MIPCRYHTSTTKSKQRWVSCNCEGYTKLKMGRDMDGDKADRWKGHWWKMDFSRVCSYIRRVQAPQLGWWNGVLLTWVGSSSKNCQGPNCKQGGLLFLPREQCPYHSRSLTSLWSRGATMSTRNYSTLEECWAARLRLRRRCARQICQNIKTWTDEHLWSQSLPCLEMATLIIAENDFCLMNWH